MVVMIPGMDPPKTGREKEVKERKGMEEIERGRDGKRYSIMMRDLWIGL